MPKFKHILLVVGLLVCIGQSTMADPLKAAAALIQRVTPDIATKIQLGLIQLENGKDVFEISTVNNRVLIKGNNAIAIASGYNWYLKYYCNVHWSWNGTQMKLPKVLPKLAQPLRKAIQPDYRVYMNYCTFNYSASWWNWERWQQEIDFMAMNGINMPLSVVGLEGVWYKSLLKIGFTDQEARSFLVGPAFLAWQWMTNIESFGGPLPKNWIDDRITLGKKILQREVELGMKPIQQGFSGYVPATFKEKFPQSKIQFGHGWAVGGFKPTAQLDPLDPMFKKFGTLFLNQEKELFGTYGLYAADPFHEGQPPQSDSVYLSNVGKAITNLIVDFDPQAKWIMQSWSIRKNIATAVPKNRLLILDLAGWNEHDDFWGYDYVVGNLHNFGGRINLHGDVQRVAANQYIKAKKRAPNAVGYGLFMEGITQNPIYYELAFEMPFHTDSVDLEKWLQRYTQRRYGASNSAIDSAWLLLLKGPYQKGTDGVEKSSIIAARSALQVKKSGPNDGLHIPYPPLLLQEVLQKMLDQQTALKTADAYRFDVVDVERQMLSNLGQEIHKQAIQAYDDKDVEKFKIHSNRYLQLLRDVDTLVSTRPEYSFDQWVDDARKWAKTTEERKLYDWNASMLVTLWGGNTGDKNYSLFDYSWREWGGLINGYYLPRWQQFYHMLETHLQNGTVYKEDHLPMVYGRERFRANAFYDGLANWEVAWVNKEKVTKQVPKGQELPIANLLYKKYQPLLRVYYSK